MSLFFDLEHTVVRINGHRLGGWADEEDAFMLPDIDLYETTRGADGKMLANSTATRGGEVTIKLLANSPSTAFFMQQWAQIVQGGRVEFNGSWSNSQSGASGRFQRGVMKKGPAGQTLGKSAAATREFVFDFESILATYDSVSFFSGPGVKDGLSSIIGL